MADPMVVAVAVIPVESKDSNGVVTYHQFEPGEVVKGHGVTKELIETLRANGSVAEPPATLPDVVAEKDALEARVAELEQKLEDAKKAAKEPAPPTAPVTPLAQTK